jgi:hypothetical protein
MPLNNRVVTDVKVVEHAHTCVAGNPAGHAPGVTVPEQAPYVHFALLIVLGVYTIFACFFFRPDCQYMCGAKTVV